MTTPFVLAPAAERDIVEIGPFIERDDPSAARRLVEDFYAAFAHLAAIPGLGHRRTDLPVLFWPVRRRYLVVYRGDRTPLEVVRVLSGYRNVAALLGAERA